jgi:nucleoside-diphosphate-sugar epimerase
MQSTDTEVELKPFSIMVTGATGFIGSRLIEKLTSKGYSVTGLSRREIKDTPNVRYIKTDVFDLEKLTRSFGTKTNKQTK